MGYSRYPRFLLLLLLVAPTLVVASFLNSRKATTTTTSTTHPSSLLRAGASATTSSSTYNNMGSKAVLVTGANKGIGKAICEKLLAEYPDVTVLLGSRDEGRGQAAVQDLTKSIKSADGRVHCIPLDTSSDESVQAAVPIVKQYTDGSLYGIVNNAGIMKRDNVDESNNVNYFGPRRVNDAFGSMLQRPGGRIVNIASASGPIFVSNCPDASLCQKLSQPWTCTKGGSGVDELDEIARDAQLASKSWVDAYGFSKALVSAYTWWLAKELDQDGIIVNCVTPGYILTDMTKGAGASNPPSKGAIPPTWLLMDPELEHVPTGRYYGSDCKRSPLDVYRGPGDPVYEGPDGK